MHLVVTACTSRKRAQVPPDLCGSSLEAGSIACIAEAWSERLRDSSGRVPVAELYAGRSFQEALQATSVVNGKLAVASAGLGLVAAEKRVPPYNLTVSGASSDSIAARTTEKFDASEWWSAISAKSPFAQPLAELASEGAGAIVLALSQPYLAMIADEVSALGSDILGRVRIITRAPIEAVEPNLRPFLMPYDDRIDGTDSPIRGTRGDFASRAAHHFAKGILTHDPLGSLDAHSAAVREKLSQWRFPAVIQRARHDDAALLQILRENWKRGDGQSSKLLRILRDDLSVACEQGRFATLMSQLRGELGLFV